MNYAHSGQKRLIILMEFWGKSIKLSNQENIWWINVNQDKTNNSREIFYESIPNFKIIVKSVGDPDNSFKGSNNGLKKVRPYSIIQ